MLLKSTTDRRTHVASSMRLVDNTAIFSTANWNTAIMPDSPDNVVPITSDARAAVKEFGAEHNRQLLAILFTDLVDSTKQQSDLGNVEASRLTELHRKIVRDELENYDAREISWSGDSCLAVFATPSDAVLFAVRMQSEHRRLRQSERNLPSVRVGIHLGEIVIKKRADGSSRSEDLFGLQISEAARVMSLARGDQIYCTRAVFDNARTALKGSKIEGVGDLAWRSHGAYLLKGVSEPVEICEVGDASVESLGAPEANDKCQAVRPSPMDPDHRGPVSPLRRWSVAVIVLFAATLAIVYFVRSSRTSLSESANSVAEPTAAAVFTPEAVQPKPVKRGYLGLSLPAVVPAVAITPDGSAVVYVTRSESLRNIVAVQEIGKLKGRTIENTEGAIRVNVAPDGQHVAYWDYDDRRIDRVPIGGGPPATIVEVIDAPFFQWSGDYIYAGRVGKPLYRVSAAGGEREQLTYIRDTGGGGHTRPDVLPENRGILFTSFESAKNTDWHTFVTNDDGPPSRLIPFGYWARYIPTGHVVYFKEGVAMVAPFDLETRSLAGEGVPLEEEGLTTDYAFSDNGTLVYFAATDPDSQGNRVLAWVDLTGDITPIPVAPKEYTRVTISPEGLRAVVAASRDVWLYEIGRAMLQRMTTNPAMDMAAIFIDDGRSIIFSSDRAASLQLFMIPTMPSAGEFEPTQITEHGPPRFADTWDEVGQRIVYSQLNPETGFDTYLGRLTPDDDADFQPVVQTPANEGSVSLSPNGKWVAFSTDEEVGGQIYVSSFPSFEGKYRVSIDGGSEPVWAPEGDAIYFRHYPAMMRAPVHAEETFRAETPVELFRNPRLLASPIGARMYDVHPDGDRFLMITFPEENQQKLQYQLVVVENWFEELKRLAPYPEAD